MLLVVNTGGLLTPGWSLVLVSGLRLGAAVEVNDFGVVDEAVDPVVCGGERVPVTGVPRLDTQRDRRVGPPGAGWAEHNHVVFRVDATERPQVATWLTLTAVA